MGVAHDVSNAVGKVLGNVRAGAEKLAPRKLGAAMLPSLEVRIPSLLVDGRLPRSATKDGEGVAPAVQWSSVPAHAQSIALVCEDPDAPMPEPFVHWLVYGIPPTATSLDPAKLGSTREGKNSVMRSGFTPAAPPPGHGVHHYHFQVLALDRPLELEPGAGRSKLFEAMRGHVVAWGEAVGTYERR